MNQRLKSEHPTKVRLTEILSEVQGEYDHVISLPPIVIEPRLPDADGGGAITWALACAFFAGMMAAWFFLG